ncbi:hypothetical protein GPECTOR_16g740 [Gonium pectorale]|uniref:phytol kinase n=1 Tax=Gonium pectorale TaxID=33097 RepID=A0A150GLF1_GONPE|nr:hypothetical protein GPECTOR_16g740 [Gonium pectorale]|eukprot:KXZ50565.1 hypothetical protein GPECTOR_16g740 [Gonium pectorale]
MQMALFVTGCAVHIQQAHATATALECYGGDTLGDSRAVAAAAQRVRDRSQLLYQLLVSELYGSQALEHSIRLLQLLTTLAAANTAGSSEHLSNQEAVDSRVLYVRSITTEMLSFLGGAYIRSAAAPMLAVPRTTDSRPDVPPPPWGPCAQYLALANAVSALAEAGFGGGDGEGGGMYGLPPELAAAMGLRRSQELRVGSGGSGSSSLLGRRPELLFETLLALLEVQLDCGPGGNGSGEHGRNIDGGGVGVTATTSGGSGGGASGSTGLWSFIISPRAAHRLCMRITDLAIASGQEAAGTAAAVGQRQQQADTLCHLLPAGWAWHVAVRALAVARGLLLGPMRRAGVADPELVPQSLGSEPLLPVEYWRAVGRVLRMDAQLREANGRLHVTHVPLFPRLSCMLEIPDMCMADSLASAEPSASVAAALSSGLVAGLERCSRFFGRSEDPDDVGALYDNLLPALVTQPSFFPHLLAFGPPGEVASFLTTLAKLLHRCVDEAEEAADKAQPAAAGAGQPSLQWPGSASRGAMDGGREAVGHICKNMASLASNLTTVAVSVFCDPRVFPALALEGPATVRPQLRQLLSLIVQRYLPPLARAVLLAPRLPRSYVEGLDLFDIALGSMDFGAMVLFNATDPTRLPPLAAATASTTDSAASSTAAAATPASESASAVSAAARAATVATTVSGGPEARAAARAESWRSWLRGDGCGERLLQELRQRGAALLPPAEAGAGLPLACANPRCINLACDSEAELMAAAGGGGQHCGGCGSARYCSAECQRTQGRAGHSAE